MRTIMPRSIIVLIFIFLFSKLHAQDHEFGFSVRGGLSAISNSHSMIQSINNAASYPSSVDNVRPVSVWNTNELSFDYYPKGFEHFSFALGLRIFRYSFERDSVARTIYYGSINPYPNGYWITHYGRRTYLYGYVLPTFTVNYEVELKKSFYLKSSLSVGVTSVIEQRWRETTAYSTGQEAFDYEDNGYSRPGYDVDFEKDKFDLKLCSMVSWRKDAFSIFVGPSLYYFKNRKEWDDYFGIHVEAGMSFRFGGKGE